MQDPQNPFGQPPQYSPIPAPTGEMNATWNNSGSDAAATSGMGSQSVLPAELKGFNWGAFFLNWIWAIGHNTWIGLLALIPYIGFVMAIVLGFKGNEMAWQNRKWSSVQEFKDTQRVWTKWGIGIFVVSMVVGLGFVILGASLRSHVPQR